MRILKGFVSIVPLAAVAISIGWHGNSIIFAYPVITWFGLGFIAATTFWLINLINGDASIGDLLFGGALVGLGFFSAIMIGVMGLVSLGDPKERAAYIADQVSREARSGIFD